jgi:hypothetical protein
MLSYMAHNNDLFFYFENDEINRFESEKIEGVFVNFYSNPIICGTIDAVVDDELGFDLAKTKINTDTNLYVVSMSLIVKRRVYDDFKRRRSVELHQGYRHISLIDVNNLSDFDIMGYNLLKGYASLQEK